MLQQRITNGFQLNNNNDNIPVLNSIFPWITHTQPEISTNTELLKDIDVVQDLSQHNTDNNHCDMVGILMIYCHIFAYERQH